MTEPMGNMTDDVPPAVQRRGGALVPSICVFDVNETLLDIEFLAPLFQRLFGDRKVLREWFGQLILYSEAITPVRALHDVLYVGTGRAEDAGLDPRRIDSAGRH